MSAGSTALEAHRVEVRGLGVHARVGGRRRRRRPIVLVHGLGLAGESLEEIGARLADRHPVWIPDLPGFGGSDHPRRALSIAGLASALGHWLEAVGLEGMILVGNSLGAQVVAEGIARDARVRPRTAGAVLIGPTCDPPSRSLPMQVWRWLANAPADDGSDPSAMATAYRTAGVGRVLRTLHSSTRHRIEDRLPQLAVPTLLVSGTRDRISPLPWNRELLELLADAELATLDGAHSMHASHAEELAELVADFAERRLRATGRGPSRRRPSASTAATAS